MGWHLLIGKPTKRGATTRPCKYCIHHPLTIIYTKANGSYCCPITLQLRLKTKPDKPAKYKKKSSPIWDFDKIYRRHGDPTSSISAAPLQTE